MLIPTPSRLRGRSAFAVAAAFVVVAALASSTPSPLYADYAARWHFSATVLTTVYGIYPLSVVVALIGLGRLSDEVGRRPVLAAAFVVLAVALVLFAVARSVWWLLAARALQGVATGPLLSAATAALIDLEPARDNRRAGLVNGICMVAGIGIGALASAALVQAAPGPRVTPYLVVLALALAAIAAVAALPEPVAVTGVRRLRPQWPHVPADIRRPFVLAGAIVLASFSISGVYLALAPGLAGELLQTHSHLAGGLAVFVLGGAGALAQLAWRAVESDRAMRRGLVAMALGMALIVTSLSTSSAALFWAGCAVTGGGSGLAFLGAGRTVAVIAPLHQRAGVMSALYVVAYGSLSVPAVACGFLVTGIGLEPTFRVFGVAVIVLVLLTAARFARLAPQVRAG